MQRRHAIHLRHIHVGALLEQRADDHAIRLFGGIRQLRFSNRQLTHQQSRADCEKSSHQTESGSNNPSTFPLLSANFSSLTPNFSSRVRWRFASGVGLEKVMWRLPFMPVAVPPATRMGRFVWSWMFGLPMPLP